MKEKSRIGLCENAGEKKTFEEKYAKHFKEIDFEFMSLGPPQKI